MSSFCDSDSDKKANKNVNKQLKVIIYKKVNENSISLRDM